MDPLKKIADLEAERDALKKAVAVPGISEAKELAIRKNFDTVGAEITALFAHLPPQGTIKLPFIGFEFERSFVGSVEALVTVFGVPPALFWAWRHGRIAWFKWRYERVPYPPEQVAYFVRKFDLNPTAFKEEPLYRRWQPEAIKAGIEGAFAFGAVAWMRMRSQLERPNSNKKNGNNM